MKTKHGLFFMALLAMLGAWLVMPGEALAQSQSKDPPLPPPLQTLAQQGAQIRYLGRNYGLDGWITIKSGKEQYFYVTPDGEAMVMGLMFDKDGKMVTLRQIADLREEGGDALDAFAGAVPKTAEAEDTLRKPTAQYKSPAEQLYSDLESSNWVKLGNDDAPFIYMFVDPQCPYCKALTNDLRDNYIKNGLVQVRMIPVGFRDETRAQAAFLLAAPDPQGRWFRHLDGDPDALPVTRSINEQGVQRNLAIMQSWKFNVTPLTVYRSKDGEVKIVQGRARNVAEVIADLP